MKKLSKTLLKKQTAPEAQGVLPKTVTNNYNKLRPQLTETGLNIT